MSSLAVGRGLEDLEVWIAGLFSAADLLLQLSVAKAKGIDDEEAASWSATSSPSPRSATPGCDSEDVTVEEEKKELEEEWVVENPAVSSELDRGAKKRYRRLSELYAATVPVTSASAASAGKKKKKKRKRHHHRDDGFGSSSSSVDATRYYGGDY